MTNHSFQKDFNKKGHRLLTYDLVVYSLKKILLTYKQT